MSACVETLLQSVSDDMVDVCLNPCCACRSVCDEIPGRHAAGRIFFPEERRGAFNRELRNHWSA